MKKLDSKLFREFKLNNNESSKINGGLANYTNTAVDTAATNGYDIEFDTYDSQGNFVATDTEVTTPLGGTRDKPGECD